MGRKSRIYHHSDDVVEEVEEDIEENSEENSEELYYEIIYKIFSAMRSYKKEISIPFCEFLTFDALCEFSDTVL